MSMKVQEIYDIIDQIAPFELAEEWDNVGILAGSADQEIERVLCALELNPAVISEAQRKDVQLIVTIIRSCSAAEKTFAKMIQRAGCSANWFAAGLR